MKECCTSLTENLKKLVRRVKDISNDESFSLLDRNTNVHVNTPRIPIASFLNKQLISFVMLNKVLH